MSKRVMPLSIAVRTVAMLSCSSKSPIPPPIGHAPKPITGTSGPFVPNRLCCIVCLLKVLMWVTKCIEWRNTSENFGLLGGTRKFCGFLKYCKRSLIGFRI